MKSNNKNNKTQCSRPTGKARTLPGNNSRPATGKLFIMLFSGIEQYGQAK